MRGEYYLVPEDGRGQGAEALIVSLHHAEVIRDHLQQPPENGAVTSRGRQVEQRLASVIPDPEVSSVTQQQLHDVLVTSLHRQYDDLTGQLGLVSEDPLHQPPVTRGHGRGQGGQAGPGVSLVNTHGGKLEQKLGNLRVPGRDGGSERLLLLVAAGQPGGPGHAGSLEAEQVLQHVQVT